MIILWTYGLKTYFRRWLIGTIERREDLISSTAHDIYKLAWVLHKYELLGKKHVLDLLRKRFCVRNRRLDVVKRLARNIYRKLKVTIDYMADNVRKHKKQNMIKAVHKMCDIKAKDDFALMTRFYFHWVDIEELRKRRLKSKYIGVMLNLVRFNEQTCFWRWKYNMKPGYLPTNPKHVLLYKRLNRIANKVNMRYIRCAYFYILVKCRPAVPRDGRYSVNEGIAAHAMRLAGRFTPQP